MKYTIPGRIYVGFKVSGKTKEGRQINLSKNILDELLNLGFCEIPCASTIDFGGAT